MTASHILVKDEATCKELKAEIEKGASFEEVNMMDASALIIKGLFSNPHVLLFRLLKAALPVPLARMEAN